MPNNMHRDPVGPQEYRYHDTDLIPLYAQREFERQKRRQVNRDSQGDRGWNWVCIAVWGLYTAIIVGGCAWVIVREWK